MHPSSLIILLPFLIAFVLPVRTAAHSNPFTPRAAFARYWNQKIQADRPHPPFLLSKSSPLTAVQTAVFSDVAALPRRLPEFCAAAGLFCFPDLSASLEQHPGNPKFSTYGDKNFSNYGNSADGGLSSFKNYSVDFFTLNSFRRYSRESTGRRDAFTIYGESSNVNDQRFISYATASTGGSGQFTRYGTQSNVPDHRFTSYSTEANGRSHSFSAYATDGNSGGETFISYGKRGNGVPNEFTSYANNTNVNSQTFNNYGESGNAANDTFKFYGFNGNVPEINFRNYGEKGNGAVDSFDTYREKSNVGDESFVSYAKDANDGEARFVNYGKSFNEGTSKFSGYGVGTQNAKVAFATYGVNNTFAAYNKNGAVFKDYSNGTRVTSLEEMKKRGKEANKWAVEEGKFFRERNLKKGTIMAMPDIKDKMPQRRFLPRSIASRLPFSTSKIEEIKEIFHARNESAMERIILEALGDCERAPSAGETKRCVASAEDLIDFATSMLGRNVAVRTTESVRGSKGKIQIGDVRGINGGAVTRSVSCHQSLYPYLLYYCHSVPKVRVYEADILDPATAERINRGVAICHVDTSSWSRTHGAFIALGGGPGKIEVCHWIFENDMTWTIAD